jgi:hypothetical protein
MRLACDDKRKNVHGDRMMACRYGEIYTACGMHISSLRNEKID